jgi:hypothetical protein
MIAIAPAPVPVPKETVPSYETGKIRLARFQWKKIRFPRYRRNSSVNLQIET